jgi:hypothetical protein
LEDHGLQEHQPQGPEVGFNCFKSFQYINGFILLLYSQPSWLIHSATISGDQYPYSIA